MLKALIANPVAHRRNSNGGHFSSTAFSRSSYSRIVTPGPGIISPPYGAIAMRVAVVGSGGATDMSTSRGGGGGGCAASKIVRAEVINYYIAKSIYNRTESENTEAKFGVYHLIAESGKMGHYGLGNGRGGNAFGGDFNYRGGVGMEPGIGGGAAGPHGDGNGRINSNGWGVGGGLSGREDYSSGGGTGAYSFIESGANFQSLIFGAPPLTRYSGGGEMGGGAGGASYHLGGVGGMVVEWFYK